MPVVTDMSALERELAALHRGRGLRRPALAIGPVLRETLHLDPQSPADVMRDNLVAALRASAQSLPGDLRTVFLIASGLEAADPLLGDRIERAGAELQRDGRTVRRRLAEANRGVATTLLRGSRGRGETGNAWYIEEFDAETDLRGPHPILHARKLAVPTQGGLTVADEQFSMPPPHPDAPEPTIRVTQGGDLAYFAREGERVWRYGVRLDQTTEAGVAQAIGIEITIDSREWLLPYTVFSAYRPTRALRTTVHFGEPPVGRRVWELHGVYPLRLLDEEPAATDLEFDLSENTTISREFFGLQLGLAYGIRWLWR